MIVLKSTNPLIFSKIPPHINFLIKRSVPGVGNQDKIPLVLEGKKGTGKSCQLSLIGNDWLKKGGLVMFESGIPMVNGSFPYSINGNEIDTPKLSLGILQRFKKLNSLESHAGIKTLIGKANDSNASQVLKDLLDVLSETPRVLLMIDQINALYSKSSYHDQDSNQLYSHRLLVPSLFLQILKSKKISSCIASDYTNTLYQAYALQDLVSRNGGISKPSSLNISQDEFPRELLPDVRVHVLENLSKEQVQEWIEIYAKEGVIGRSIRKLLVY